jgi:hypothetical protein
MESIPLQSGGKTSSGMTQEDLEATGEVATEWTLTPVIYTIEKRY